MNIKIIVATHKRYWMPEDKMYLPVFVGAEGKEGIGYQSDNEGDNISNRNKQYCELTGMYWAWKNIEADAYGLVHYRRYFKGTQRKQEPGKNKSNLILGYSEAEELLEKYPVILTKKRNYYIETIYSHYAHTHYAEHLDIARTIIESSCPEYLDSFDWVMKKSSAHMFNMFIMRKKYFQKYCKWLFPILTQIDKQIDYQKYDAYQARIQGRISEMLLDVWLRKNHIAYKELPVINLERINWKHKISCFLKARILGKKYDSSF